MYVVPPVRGTGVATAILAALESWAIEHQIHVLRLETGDLLVAAQRFYEREGYAPIPPFGPYVGSALSRCYEKPLSASECTTGFRT
jgi:GNAT superfamily N-acetyltransferase